MTSRVASLLTLLSLVGFLVIALLALQTGGLHVRDAQLLARLYRHDHGAVHAAAEALRRLGELPVQLVLVAVAATIGLRRGLADRAVTAVILVAGADLTAQLLKHLIVDGRFGRADQVFAINEHTFPSGHATTMTAVTFAYLLVVPARLRPVVAVLGAGLTLLVAAAMVVLRRHWPSDAVGGVFLGCIWGFGSIAVLSLRR